MIIRIVLLFLLFMVVMGAIKKFWNPNHKTPLDKLRMTKLPRPGKCKQCGKFLLRGDRCDCKDK